MTDQEMIRAELEKAHQVGDSEEIARLEKLLEEAAAPPAAAAPARKPTAKKKGRKKKK